MADNIDIPWEVVIFLFIAAVFIFYFLFFQQYLTALIWRLFISIFIPKNVQVSFKRVMFSIFSGHFMIFDVTIITQDISIHVDKLAGILYYWRKIPNFTSDEEKLKSRFLLTFFGLDITIYNRTWSTDLVESVRTLFEDGKSTQEITDFVLSQYPCPAPYQLSVLLRMILPLNIRIYAVSLKIGNPRMPAYLIFRAESISGLYTLIPRKSPEHSIQSYLDVDILTFSLKSKPMSIRETEYFKKSMANIYNRSHRSYQIMKAEYIELHILTDLYGLYIQANEEDSISQVTEQPQMIIDATFFKKSTIIYGPYMDKLRRFFMDYFSPFVFNDTILYPESKKRIKFWVVNLFFPDGSNLSMPFEIKQENPREQEKEKSKGSINIHIGKKSSIQMHIPQYIESVDENKFQLTSALNDIKIYTSIPGKDSQNSGPPLLEAKNMNLNVYYIYPEIWNHTSNLCIFSHFQDAVIILTPYHIEYLTEFGADFSSYYPFLIEEETIHNFFPYAYYINLVFENSFIKLFSEPYPKYESFYFPDNFPQTEIKMNKFTFVLSLPLLNFQEKHKSVSFTAEIDKGIVFFYLPKYHMSQIRRGIEEKYDYVSMDKFQLSGSYLWSSDPTDDCQIPISIRISSVDGLITIGTLVNLIGTIANYTSREKQRPKVWEDPNNETKRKEIYDYINNTSAIVQIDRGKVKVPLDLYEPNAGAIAHASGILISVESYHPFWHAMVDIGCAVVELPRTNFPYDTYFNERYQSPDSPKEGTFHVEYIHITMKTISTFTGTNYADIHTKIGCEIGNIDGYALMPQLFCGLEIAWNIIHSFFGDDVSAIRQYDPFYIYKVEVFRICIGSIRVYLDMGKIGLVCAMLPGGVVVYSDTLIDENAHYVIFVHLPSIDAHILQYSEEEERVHAIFRTSTYLNVVRDIKFHGNPMEDAIRQNQLLRMYDVIPHPERFVGGSKRNYYTYLFDFINQDKSQLSSEYFYIPEMMRPETYHSSLNEEYDLALIKVTDSRNNDEYTLMIPELRYASYKNFINMEDGINWLHHYETVRFYNHLSPINRNLKNIPPANPSTFATQYYDEDKFRARDSNGAIRLVLPNTVIIQLLPTALINASALLTSFNSFPNEELMAKIVRSTVGDEFDLKNYHSSTINVILPQVKVLIHHELFGIALTVDNVNIRYVSVLTKTLIEDAPKGRDKKVSVDFDKNLTLYIEGVNLECINAQNNHPSIMVSVPHICLVNVNDKGAAKINPIKFYFANDSPTLLRVLLQTLPKYLEDLPVPNIGEQCDELVRCIKSSPIYKEELRHFLKHCYSPGECNTRFKVNCELSALYSTLKRIGLVNFTTLRRDHLIEVPPKPVPNSHSLMTVDLPTISLLIQPSKSNHIKSNDPTLKIVFTPLEIESQKDITSISCGIESLTISLSNDIIRFVKELIPTSSEKKKRKKKKKKTNSTPPKSRKRFSQQLNYLSDNDYYYSEERNTVAEAKNSSNRFDFDDYGNEEEEEEEENEEEIKPSDILPKPKEKPNNSKICAHFVANLINITFNELSIKLDNISVALSVQLSKLTKALLTASFNNFDVSVNKWVSLCLKGVSLTHNGELGEGFVHVKPITIYLFLDFIINAKDYIDFSFVDEILGELQNDNNNENNDDYDTNNASNYASNNFFDNPFESIMSARQKPTNSDNNSNTVSKNEILNILKQMSTSLLIDALTIDVAITTKNKAEIVFPRALGFMFSADERINALCYFHQAEFTAKNYFSFPIPFFIFDFKIRPDDIEALIWVGDILVIGKSKQLSNAATLVNEILSKFEKLNKKPKSPNISNHQIQYNKKKEANALLSNSINNNNHTTSKLNALIKFNLLKLEVKIEELSTSLLIQHVQAEAQSINSILTWRFDVDEISGEVFDSKFSTSINGSNSKKKKKIKFSVNKLDLMVSHNLFNKIPLFASFANVILKGFSKQKHVNTFLHQLNDNIKFQVESRAENLLDHNRESNDKLEFPTVLKGAISFKIENIKLQLLLHPSGSTIVTIPIVSLDVMSKSSRRHSKQALGAKFQIIDFNLVLDSDEGLLADGHSKRNKTSSIHIAKFIVSALSFQNDIDFESIVNGLNVMIFPTIPSAISKILLIVFALSANISKAKEKFEHNSDKKDVINRSHMSPNSGNASPVKPRNNSLLLPQRHPSSPTRRVSTARFPPAMNDIKPKIIKTTVTGFFECTNAEINLSPIDNKLQIPSIEVRFMFIHNDLIKKENNLNLSLYIPIKVLASLTPALIDYLGKLKTILPVLSRESQLQKQEEYIEQQKELKKEMKQKKEKLKQSADILRASTPVNSSHHRSKSVNSNSDLAEEDEDDDILKFAKKLSFGIHITVCTKNLEICFSCQPRRNDVSCLIGISGVSAAVSTQTKCFSVQIIDFYLHTNNIFAIQTADVKTSRLFQFNIPRIDILFGKSSLMLDIEKVFSSFSSDKVEEITLFNDIWIQPFLKMVGTDNNDTVKSNSFNSDAKALQVSSFDIEKIKRSKLSESENYPDEDLQLNNNSSKSLVSTQDESSAVIKSNVLNIEVIISIKTIELSFNYAAGHDNIDFTFQPIYITKTPELIFASVNEISCSSKGQLALMLKADNFYFINANSNSSLMNVIHLTGIKSSMSMAGDTFLLASVSQANLLCRIKKVEIGNTSTILELSIDTPQIKMTALTVPTLKTLIKTITEPIINGVARANRSESNIELAKSRLNQAKETNNYKTAPVMIPPKTRQNSLIHNLLFAKLSVVVRDARIVLLRYVFRDTDAVMLSIDAVMFHLDLKPKGKGMNRNLHFSFMPTALVRLTNNDVSPNATNPAAFQLVTDSKQSKNKNSKSKDTKNAKAKTRPILKIPQVNGTLDTQQKIVYLPDVTYNFYTEFFGNIEPSLNLSDYEMLLALIKYTIANANLNKTDDDYQRKSHKNGSESDSDGYFGSIGNHPNNNSGSQNSGSKNKNLSGGKNGSNGKNSNNSVNNKNSNNKNSNNSNNNSSSNNKNDEDDDNSDKNKEKDKLDLPKITYNFTPLNYKFAPSFKVGYGASINPDVKWLLARFGISDEHIIPASLFQFLCIGLENFLNALSNSMTKANQDEEDM